MMDIAAYYDASCKVAKHSWQAACWASEEDQYARFSLVNNISFSNSSILDVGCGQGDFYAFMSMRHKDINYKGIDVSRLMIENAKRKFPKGNFVQQDFFSDLNEKFDYVFALGPFSFKTEENQYEYIEKALKKCFALCNKATVITLTVDQSDFKHEKLFYYCSQKILALALSVTPYVILNTASLPCELILFMYKE